MASTVNRRRCAWPRLGSAMCSRAHRGPRPRRARPHGDLDEHDEFVTAPAPTASLVNLTPHVKGGSNLTLSAAGSVIPRGQRASSYTFQLGTGSGAVTTTCPGQFPGLNTIVTHGATTKATVTVNTTAGTSATASTLVTVSRLVSRRCAPRPGRGVRPGAHRWRCRGRPLIRNHTCRRNGPTWAPSARLPSNVSRQAA